MPVEDTVRYPSSNISDVVDLGATWVGLRGLLGLVGLGLWRYPSSNISDVVDLGVTLPSNISNISNISTRVGLRGLEGLELWDLGFWGLLDLGLCDWDLTVFRFPKARMN